jgi:hypothetical protein
MAWNYNFEPTLADGLFEHYNEEVGIITETDGSIFTTDSEGNRTPATAEELQLAQTKLDELLAIYNGKAYSRNRVAAYPSMEEQADMQYWDAVNGTTTWKDAITAVKTANPKPSE